MVKLTDDADYDAGETSEIVPRPTSEFGNDYALNGPRTSRGEICALEPLLLEAPTSSGRSSLSFLKRLRGARPFGTAFFTQSAKDVTRSPTLGLSPTHGLSNKCTQNVSASSSFAIPSSSLTSLLSLRRPKVDAITTADNLASIIPSLRPHKAPAQPSSCTGRSLLLGPFRGRRVSSPKQEVDINRHLDQQDLPAGLGQQVPGAINEMEAELGWGEGMREEKAKQKIRSRAFGSLDDFALIALASFTRLIIVSLQPHFQVLFWTPLTVRLLCPLYKQKKILLRFIVFIGRLR
ncbi:unnamed protein product [Protopolystoma xenopodis]|uniref:Uncharacterized protein n=1 Tax=Protopolystoma xenopodis TaxID=117903 RepID=A0A448XG50_9PLAT|nr:unnamed protein product [Protopolystoma xenopodis]